MIEEVTETSCQMTQVSHVDFGGSVPIKLWNYMVSTRDDTMYKASVKVLEEHKKKGYPSLIDSYRFLETMAENGMVLTYNNENEFVSPFNKV